VPAHVPARAAWYTGAMPIPKIAVVPISRVYANCSGFYIQWRFEDEFGGCIGDVAGEDQDDTDARLANAAARPFAINGETKSTVAPFIFADQATANKAATAIRTAFKIDAATRAGLPWPEWAVKANAAGWKPPRGWSPQ